MSDVFCLTVVGQNVLNLRLSSICSFSLLCLYTVLWSASSVPGKTDQVTHVTNWSIIFKLFVLPKVEYAVVMIYNIVGSSDDLVQATSVDGSSRLVAAPVADGSQSFSMMTSVQLCRRPIWWVTLYVPVLLFLFISLVWPDLDSWRFQKGGYNTVSPHAAICMLFMKNKHGKRTN